MKTLVVLFTLSALCQVAQADSYDSYFGDEIFAFAQEVSFQDKELSFEGEPTPEPKPPGDTAEEPKEPEDKPQEPPKPQGRSFCRRAKLTDTQSSQMFELRQQYRTQMQTLRKSLWESGKAYHQLIHDTASNSQQTEEAGAKWLAAKAAVSAAQVTYKNKVLFEVATPEQRKKILKCLRRGGDRYERHERRRHHRWERRHFRGFRW